MEKLEAGTILYDMDLAEYEIVKIGRKWYETDSYFNERVQMDNLKTEKDYLGHSIQLYANRDEVVATKKRSKLVEDVKDSLSINWQSDKVKKMTNEELTTILGIASKYN